MFRINSIFILAALSLFSGSLAAPTSHILTRDDDISLAARGVDDDWESPVYNNLFGKPLVIPNVLAPLITYTNTSTGEIFDFYEIKIQALTQQIYTGSGKQATNLVGYNGQVPGPTIKTTTGRRSVVRFVNQGTLPASVHLHGSPSRPVFDGWAEDVMEVGEYKDYVYPNHTPRTLWYHDHAVHITAVNAFFGQAASYIVYDPVQEAALGLPQDEYDIPLVIVDRTYQNNAQLVSPAGEDTSYYGDIIHVNGVPWPYFNVQPRKYRFRLLNASLSRSYKASVQTSSGSKLPLIVIATDAGYMEHPVSTNDIILGIAERYEIVIDFTNYAGQTLTMRNPRDFSRNEDFARTNYIMQFVVGNVVASTANNGPIPTDLVSLNFPVDSTSVVQRHFEFGRTNSEWRVNGIGFDDVANRILAKPVPGSVEKWELENTGGGWAHPIHIHLIDFKVLTRTGGTRGVEPYEAGFKDVVFLDENETATVIARFHPWSGQYMFHCHNLVHEDGDMMAAFDVGDTKANPTPGDIFSDPNGPTFAAQPWTGTDLTTVATVTLPYLAGLDIYPPF
ncbi:Cupredoxin [Peziza echinospora]|nr:Cupredoxin [Peziza echinospora]